MKSYIFIWKIDVTNVAVNDVPTYMDAAKSALLDSKRMNDLLNADAEWFFIPVRNAQPELEVLEFNIDNDLPHTRYKEVMNANNDMKEEIYKIIQNSLNK
jgi:hypothetical protein